MTPTAIASARLIGEIFVDEGLITDEQLEQALDEQKTSGELLGELLIARFGLSRAELSSALLKQLAEHELPHVTEGEAGSRDPEDAGKAATEAQLKRALKLQRMTKRRLGTILDDQGVLSQALTTALSEQLAGLQTQAPPPSQHQEHVETAAGTPAPFAEEAHDLGEAHDLAEQTHDLAEQTHDLGEEAQDLGETMDKLQERLEHVESASIDERLDEVEQRLADAVTPAQLDERVHSLTSGMLELARLGEELADRLSSNGAEGVEGVAGEVDELRAQLADRVDKELVGVVERVAELETRLASAATSAELDERLERALTTHGADLGFGLDALRHSMKQAASTADFKRLRRTVEQLSNATDGANGLAARRLAQLEARSEETAATDDRLQAALTEIANRSADADEQLRESVVEAADRAERRLAEEGGELHTRLGREVRTLQIKATEDVSSLRGSIDALAAEVVEQRRHLEAQAREDVTRLGGQLEQQEARAEEHAADAARAAEVLEQAVQRLESELRGRLERHSDRIDEQRRRLEEVRDAGERALQAAAAGLTQRLADVEEQAVASAGGLRADLGQLGEQVAGQAVASAHESAAARADLERLRRRLDDVTLRLDGHEHEAAGDTERAQKELDEVRSGIAALDDRLDAYGGDTTRHLDAVRKNVGRLQAEVEELPARLEGQIVQATDATSAVRRDLVSLRKSLAEREAAVDARIGDTIELLAEKSTVEVLRGRLDEHEERIADARLSHHELSTELGRRLGRMGDEVQNRFDRVESGQQQASDDLERAAASLRAEQQTLVETLRDEHERSASSLRGELGEQERRVLGGLSEQRGLLAEASVELARLRQNVVENDDRRRQGDGALDARIDETRGEIALVLERVAEGELEHRRRDDELDSRLDRMGQQLASEAAEAATAGRDALRNGLTPITERLEQVEQRSQTTDEAVGAAIGKIERDLKDVAVRSAAQAAESRNDLHADLAEAAEANAVLLSRVEELSRKQEARLAKAEEALGSLGVDELRAQVAALQRQIGAQALEVRAQADAAERLRHAFTEIESKLSERQRTFQAAGDELISTFEELGHTIRTADEQVPQNGVERGETPTSDGRTFLVIAPDDENQYTMVECSGEQPAVGSRFVLEGFDSGGLIVTRVTDSPLPHDTRACVYLDRSS